MQEAIFEAFDAGVALVRGPGVPSAAHLLRDVVEHVAVLLGTFQRELHRVLAPDLQQGASLLLRPGRLPAQVRLEEASAHQLLDWVEKTARSRDGRAPVCLRIGLNQPTRVGGLFHKRLQRGVGGGSVLVGVLGGVAENRSQEVVVPEGDGTPAPAAVAAAPVRLLQPLHAGLALLRRLGKPRDAHLLRYFGKDVAVVHAGPQAVLHVVRRPHLHQGHRLRLRPRRVRAVRGYGRRRGG